jgi:hypothetical protein
MHNQNHRIAIILIPFFYAALAPLSAAVWELPITITGTATAAPIVQIRTIGGDASASQGYDALDAISPPPGLSFSSYLYISAFPNFLNKDVRPWTAPYATSLSWDLRIVNAEASGVTGIKLDWNAAQLPLEGAFTLEGLGPAVNMRLQNSTAFKGDHIVTIRYIPGSTSVGDGNAFRTVIPGEYALFPAYPNPFNPETAIRYRISNGGHVHLVIVDAAGREVVRLVDGERPAGYHLIVWDGTDEAGRQAVSGLYLAVMKAGRFRRSERILLTR